MIPPPDPLDRTQARFRFHAAPPRGEWLNDPNGLAFVGGRFRLFAQHSATPPDYRRIGWGAFTSADMLDWRFDGVAIAGEEQLWAYSGCITQVDPLEAFLTLHDTSGASPVQRQGRADGDALEIAAPDLGPSGSRVRDPFVFWCAATGDWRMLLAEPCDWTAWADTPASTIAIWASGDKREWRFAARIGPWDEPGVLWEVPLLLDYGAAQLLVLSEVDRRGDETRCSVVASVGRFYGGAFEPSGQPVPLDLGPDFYAACANTVAGWPDDARVVVGWASSWGTARRTDWPDGVQGGPISLPRILTLHGDRAIVTPIAAALPLAAWRGRWREGAAMALAVEGDDVALRFSIDEGGRVAAERVGAEPYPWSLSLAVSIEASTEVTAFIDAGLVELFFAGRSLTAFVPGAQVVTEEAYELG